LKRYRNREMWGIKRTSDNKESNRSYINCKAIINRINIESAIITYNFTTFVSSSSTEIYRGICKSIYFSSVEISYMC